MSYILDALKKLEHEKTRKSRTGGMTNISGALLEDDRPRPSGKAGWKITLAVTVAVLVTFVATWLLLKPEKVRENSAHPIVAKVPPPLPTPQVTVETSPIPSVPSVVPVQLTRPQTPSAPAQATPARRPVPPSKPQESIVQPAPAHEDDDGREVRRRTKEIHGQSLPADQNMVVPADIKLSGIAWQEERRSRRAVVNGFLMQEGGVVSGARITAIYQDRVRFSLSGKTFEIPLIASTAPTAGK